MGAPGDAPGMPESLGTCIGGLWTRSEEKRLCAESSCARLIEQRLNMPDRLHRADLLQRVMRIWLVGRPDTVIGAYWPIKGEFDPLAGAAPLEGRRRAAGRTAARRIGLPVVDKVHKTLTFHAWFPGCPMEEDAYGIPKPKDTEVIVPTLLFVPCVGYSAGRLPAGLRRRLLRPHAGSAAARPFTVGLGFTHGFLARLRARGARRAAGRHPERQRAWSGR
jgi:5-formyltetrahydrofolate cyclo-ligase